MQHCDICDVTRAGFNDAILTPFTQYIMNKVLTSNIIIYNRHLWEWCRSNCMVSLLPCSISIETFKLWCKALQTHAMYIRFHWLDYHCTVLLEPQLNLVRQDFRCCCQLSQRNLLDDRMERNQAKSLFCFERKSRVIFYKQTSITSTWNAYIKWTYLPFTCSCMPWVNIQLIHIGWSLKYQIGLAVGKTALMQVIF